MAKINWQAARQREQMNRETCRHAPRRQSLPWSIEIYHDASLDARLLREWGFQQAGSRYIANLSTRAATVALIASLRRHGWHGIARKAPQT